MHKHTAKSKALLHAKRTW